MGRNKIIILFYTIRYLKPIQIYFRIFYFVRNRFFKRSHNKVLLEKKTSLLWNDFLMNSNSYLGDNSFSFINFSKDFKKNIDWDYESYGKLWSFNLNYFDFLNQSNISIEDGLKLIKDYISKDEVLNDGKASYPISLRGINWVKFLAKHNLSDKDIDQNLYNHYQILLFNSEYHLLGNHLLENGFSFLFGAYYFRDNVLYKKGNKILKNELQEQIMNDGAHFELSPMYHQIMLFRVLDSIQLIRLNNWKDDDLLQFLENIASKMLSWLKEVTFNNGDIPMVNDSAFGIAPLTEELLNYGKHLGLEINKVKLFDSGYRMIKNEKYELFMDVGDIGASYQPAHVHSDIFNFVLYVKNQPFIVDTGVSTYEKNKVRQLERGTSSHNTVIIKNQEQTQVWGGFRVAKRAKIVSLEETKNTVSSTHDGYKNLYISHTRGFLTKKNSIIIKDDITKQVSYKQIANFHFHPSITNVIIDNSNIFIENMKAKISFKGQNISITKENYKFASGFNKTKNGIKLEVLFESNLETTINL